MYYVIGIIIVIIILLFIYQKFKKQKIENKIKKICEEYQIEYEKRKDEYILLKNQKKCHLKICEIPSNSQVTVNYKTTYCLRYGGSSNNPGRNFPKMKYLKDVEKFIEDNNDDKIIAFYPSTEKILMYLNESEIAIVGIETKPYGTIVINYKDLEEGIKYWINC